MVPAAIRCHHFILHALVVHFTYKNTNTNIKLYLERLVHCCQSERRVVLRPHLSSLQKVSLVCLPRDLLRVPRTSVWPFPGPNLPRLHLHLQSLPLTLPAGQNNSVLSVPAVTGVDGFCHPCGPAGSPLHERHPFFGSPTQSGACASWHTGG